MSGYSHKWSGIQRKLTIITEKIYSQNEIIGKTYFHYYKKNNQLIFMKYIFKICEIKHIPHIFSWILWMALFLMYENILWIPNVENENFLWKWIYFAIQDVLPRNFSTAAFCILNSLNMFVSFNELDTTDNSSTYIEVGEANQLASIHYNLNLKVLVIFYLSLSKWVLIWIRDTTVKQFIHFCTLAFNFRYDEVFSDYPSVAVIFVLISWRLRLPTYNSVFLFHACLLR